MKIISNLEIAMRNFTIYNRLAYLKSTENSKMKILEPAEMMLLEIGHQKAFDDFYRTFPAFYPCEYSFRTLFLWHDSYPVRWKIHDSRLIIHHRFSDFIMFPHGEDIPLDEFMAMSDAFAACGRSGNYSFVPEKYVKANPGLKKHFYIKHNSGNADYVYSTEKLLNLSGRLSRKKNLVSQFKRSHPDISCRSLSGAELAKAAEHAIEWENGCATSDHPLAFESKAIRRSTEHFDELGLEALGLFAGDRLEAYSVFSRFCNDTCLVHFEKSNPERKGAFQTINNETAKYLKDKCRFINREQDLGLPGLRKAKQSYHPDFMISTYTLIRHRS